MVSLVALSTSHLIPASATTTRLPPNADAWVRADRQNANNGGSSILRVLDDMRLSYVRFKVPAPPVGEGIVGATLRLSAQSASHCTLGVEVLRAASDSWGESTITWRNQPGVTGSALASATWTANGYKDFDVTAAVAGQGRVSFVIRHASGCNPTGEAVFSSREAGSNRPELVVETGPSAPEPLCADGLDNDGDGRTDFPTDPGCTSATDTDETDAPTSGTKMLAAAGDIVCGPLTADFDGADPTECQHRRTSELLAGADAVLPLGDLQYPDGALGDFNQAYDPTWGRYAAKTYPVPGNHEYHIAGAQGYFDYWSSKGRPTGVSGNGYYSYDLGSWHVIALNTSAGCTSGPPCAEGSPQNDWLETDLANTTENCIAAYWHSPLFSSGVHGPSFNGKPFWVDLYAAGTDIVLNGHEHNYQRYAKQTPSGQAASNGIREFVVGSGGKVLTALGVSDPNLEVGNDTDFGVLKLTLASNSYSWQYVGVTGAVLDSGGPVACN